MHISIGLIGGKVYIMSESKKLVVNLSEKLCDEFDKALELDNKDRNEFVKEAITRYIEEKKRLARMDLMKKGYIEMSKINLEISELGVCNELDQLMEYEASLSESDYLDDDGGEKRRYILC